MENKAVQVFNLLRKTLLPTLMVSKYFCFAINCKFNETKVKYLLHDFQAFISCLKMPLFQHKYFDRFLTQGHNLKSWI